MKEHVIDSLLKGVEIGYPLERDEVKSCLEAFGALWLYRGEPSPKKPHAILTSGLHSDGYVNVGGLLKTKPAVLKTMASTIFNRICEYYAHNHIRYVVGADTSSTALAYEVADLLGVPPIRMFKIDDGKGGTKQVWDPTQPKFKSGALILQVEDLITTAKSSLQVREGIRLANPEAEINFFHILPVIVERSAPDNRVLAVENSILLPLLRLNIRSYKPDVCPYCAAGSPAIANVKQGDNWKKLTKK